MVGDTLLEQTFSPQQIGTTIPSSDIHINNEKSWILFAILCGNLCVFERERKRVQGNNGKENTANKAHDST